MYILVMSNFNKGGPEHHAELGTQIEIIWKDFDPKIEVLLNLLVIILSNKCAKQNQKCPKLFC